MYLFESLWNKAIAPMILPSFSNGTIYTIINENNKFFLKVINNKKRKLVINQEKCATSTPESQIYGLCITCADGYKPAEVPRKILYDSISILNTTVSPQSIH